MNRGRKRNLLREGLFVLYLFMILWEGVFSLPYPCTLLHTLYPFFYLLPRSFMTLLLFLSSALWQFFFFHGYLFSLLSWGVVLWLFQDSVQYWIEVRSLFFPPFCIGVIHLLDTIFSSLYAWLYHQPLPPLFYGNLLVESVAGIFLYKGFLPLFSPPFPRGEV